MKLDPERAAKEEQKQKEVEERKRSEEEAQEEMKRQEIARILEELQEHEDEEQKLEGKCCSKIIVFLQALNSDMKSSFRFQTQNGQQQRKERK